jgi:hypothetical protein
MTLIYILFNFIFNLFLTLEILASDRNRSDCLHFTVRLEKVGVHEEWTLLTRLGHRRVRTHEALWGLAWDWLDIYGFVGIRLIKVRHGQHLISTHNFFRGLYYMCDNLHLDSIQQCETPLNTLFFSDFNKNLLQRGIRQAFKNKTGISIDYQNPDDLFSLMRVVFINNAGDQYAKVNEQVKYMNTKVIDTCLSQIQTGVSQYIAYAEDIDTISTPMDRPVNTSTTGNKIDFNNKIGIN